MDQSLLFESKVRSCPLRTYLDSTEERPLPPSFDLNEYFDDWHEVFDSAEMFNDRLNLSGHTVGSARKQFRTASADDATPVPWNFETAEQVVDRAVEYDRESVRSLIMRHNKSPFVHLLAPIVVAVRERVSLDNDYSSAACDSLYDWLLDRLTKEFQHPLFILFKMYQRIEYPETDFTEKENSIMVYNEFVEKHCNADYEHIFEQYPVLLKRLNQIARQWCGAIRRLDERVTSDCDDIARVFNNGSELGRIRNIEILSNDPHGEGEVVLGTHFENNCSVVYKPRSVAAGHGLNELFNWMNTRTDVPNLYTPAIIDKSEYGWMEFIRHNDCGSSTEVEHYYERMGAVSAVAFVLGSTDFHYENIISMGEHPVVVDQETVLSPCVEDNVASASPTMSAFLENSILETLIIPFSKQSEAGENESISGGLSDLNNEQTERKIPNSHDTNTDAMELTFDKEISISGQNLPVLDGTIQDVSTYVQSLKSGFRKVTKSIIAHRDEILDASGPLAAFDGADIRYLLRPTGHYASKLTESRYSSQLRSGLQQSLTLESLYQIFVPRTGDSDLWKLVAAEKESLQHSIIPRFTIGATEHELRDGRGNQLDVFVDKSPMEHAHQRISSLDDHQVETQLRLIDLALTDSKVSDPITSSPSKQTTTISTTNSPQDVVSNVLELFNKSAIRLPNEGLRWVEPARTSSTSNLSIREPGPDLYAGYAGVGLFLAAVAAVRGDDGSALDSRRVLKSARSKLENSNKNSPAIGGMTGIGSVAYGLLTAGRLLDDPQLIEHAKTTASQTTRDEIINDRQLDVMSGSAGELLAQLAVYEYTRDETALDRARWCGNHLLNATTKVPSGHLIPTSEDMEIRFAFAHGVGGIGYALTKLASITNSEEYARVGRSALQFDAELWRRETETSDEVGSTEQENATIWGWCNGVAGVGTSRVAVADSTSAEHAADISDLRSGIKSKLSTEDSLCCGSAGRAIFLLDAGDVFNDSSLTKRAENVFSDMLSRADREGRLRLANHLPSVPKFAAFTGLAGIGYVALQFEARRTGVDLPNVIRLETVTH